jgi:hypothetical protein
MDCRFFIQETHSFLFFVIFDVLRRILRLPVLPQPPIAVCGVRTTTIGHTPCNIRLVPAPTANHVPRAASNKYVGT